MDYFISKYNYSFQCILFHFTHFHQFRSSKLKSYYFYSQIFTCISPLILFECRYTYYLQFYWDKYLLVNYYFKFHCDFLEWCFYISIFIIITLAWLQIPVIIPAPLLSSIIFLIISGMANSPIKWIPTSPLFCILQLLI